MTRTQLNDHIKEAINALREMKKAQSSKSIMMCRHNTILAVRTTFTYDNPEYNSSSISHVVDTRKDSNLKLIDHLDEHLDCPRYEPSVAKAWLQEEGTFGQTSDEVKLEKVLLSVKQLRDLVIKQYKSRLRYLTKLKRLSDSTLSKF